MPGSFADQVRHEPGRLRIAFSRRPADGHRVHADCLAALDDAVGLLAGLGHELVEADLPGLTPDVGDAIGTAYGAYVSWILAYWIRELGREPLTRAYWEHGLRLTGGDYLLAVTTLQHFARTTARFLSPFDTWLTPTLAQPPLLLGEMTSTEDEPLRAAERSAPFVAFPAVVANITGVPAMSVPLYWSGSGLPIGVHFLGRVGDEATLLRLAAQLEHARPWADRRPDRPATPTWHDPAAGASLEEGPSP
ncbi:amidase family protein [Streptomyces sp. R33]|uniref:Amidase family protein n=1 Tax=Streptomyces sp. R33 TaxID=3238629 RepID=A0AB39XY54_9ACTN